MVLKKLARVCFLDCNIFPTVKKSQKNAKWFYFQFGFWPIQKKSDIFGRICYFFYYFFLLTKNHKTSGNLFFLVFNKNDYWKILNIFEFSFWPIQKIIKDSFWSDFFRLFFLTENHRIILETYFFSYSKKKKTKMNGIVFPD